LYSLEVEAILHCEDGRYFVYFDRKSGNFIVAGSWSLVFGDEEDPLEMFATNRIFGEGKDLESMSVQLEATYGKHFWLECRIAHLNSEGPFAPLLFEEWKKKGVRDSEIRRCPFQRDPREFYRNHLKENKYLRNAWTTFKPSSLGSPLL
jgi:hypothetical protein